VESINTTIDYYSKLHDNLFTAYKKELGPFSRASVKDGGDQIVTVAFRSNLLAVEHLVGWELFRQIIVVQNKSFFSNYSMVGMCKNCTRTKRTFVTNGANAREQKNVRRLFKKCSPLKAEKNF
jgi:hypothetical protein